MRYSLILLVAALLLSLGIRYFADPMRQAQISTNPAHELQDMTARDPQLEAALASADAGNLQDLTDWINRAEPEDRQRLATLLLRVTEYSDGKHDGFDTTLALRYMNRFRAFMHLSTGSPIIDTDMDNLMAYALATATPNPSPADLDLAKQLLPRLSNGAQGDVANTILNTIGCVQFQLTDFDAAKKSYADALACAAQLRDPPSHEQLALYQRRLEAATHNAELKAGALAHPEAPAPTYLPLPPEDVPPDAAAEPPAEGKKL